VAEARDFGAAAWNRDVQARFVTVELATGGSHQRKRPEVHERSARAARDPQPHGAFALELAVQDSADPPAGFRATRDQVILGSAQRSIGAEAHESREDQLGRLTLASAKVESQHRSL